MNDFESELENFHKSFARFASRKNRFWARVWHGVGEFIGASLVAVLIYLIITIFD